MPFIVTDTGEVVNEIIVPGGWAIMADSGIGIVESIAGEQGPQATVRFKVYDANSRFLFTQQLMGQWTGSGSADLLYVGPFAYPPSPNLICTRIDSIESLGPLRPMAMHQADGGTLDVVEPWLYGESAIVTATFTRPPWMPAANGGYFTIEFAGNGKKEDIPGTYYTFDSNGVRSKKPLSILLMGAEITVTRYRMPFLPDLYMIPLAGTINAAPFQIGNVMYAAGTLLFGPGNSITESDPNGLITYRAQYKFLYRNPGWNYWMNPVTLQWDTTTPAPYQPGDFTTLP